MPWSNGGGRRSGGGGGPPRDLEDLLKRSQDKLKQAMPGGSGVPGSFLFLVGVVTIAVAAFFAFTFRVDPDELGISCASASLSEASRQGCTSASPIRSRRYDCPR